MFKKIIKMVSNKNPDSNLEKEIKPPDFTQNEIDPLNRRFPGGQLKGFPSSFFKARNQILAEELLPKVYENCQSEAGNKIYDQLLKHPEYSKYDERMVEYSWILLKLTGFKHNKGLHLLDVGCVLNQGVISSYISSMIEMVWFMNPAPEPFAYQDRVAYILSNIGTHKLPGSLQFDIVTCLSTIEHIGMDTKRYGGPGGEVNLYPDNPQRNAIEALQSLYQLVRPGGTIYISVPYGPFEYLYDYGGKLPIYYTFDQRRLEDFLSYLPSQSCDVSIEVYKTVSDVGWIKTELTDKNIPGHAVAGCAAAGGVALIEIVCPKDK